MSSYDEKWKRDGSVEQPAVKQREKDSGRYGNPPKYDEDGKRDPYVEQQPQRKGGSSKQAQYYEPVKTTG